MRWTAILRWLRRYNVVLWALLGTLALILPVAIGVTYLVDRGYRPADSFQVAVQSEDAEEETDTLRLEIVREFSAPAHLLGALVEDNTGRGALYMTRNLVLYDLATGQGRRVFPNDDGHVGRYAPVTAQCTPTRPLNAPASVTARETEAAAAAAAPPPIAVGVVALWREQGETQWRLGLMDLRDGAWREVAADVASLETLSGAPGGACRAILRRGDGLHAITFGFGAGDTPVDTLLAIE